MKKITLYVDIVSPFAYEAYYILRHDPAFQTCQITYIPVFLGGIMKAAGNTAPIYIHNKDKWINTERLRWATYFSIPMVPETPKGFPHLTLPVMRALCALVADQHHHHHHHHQQTTTEKEEEEEEEEEGQQPHTIMTSPAAQQILIPALDAFFDAYWVQGRIVSEKDVLREVLGQILAAAAAARGEDGDVQAQVQAQVDKIIALAATEGKKMLQAYTDEAYAEGAFGLPWMVCEKEEDKEEAGRGKGNKRKEGFWGVDHLGMVVDFLGLEKLRGGGWRAML